MTDQEVVKGRWPEAEAVWPNGILNSKENKSSSFRLGWDWHEARQHPSVVDWEKTHSFFIGSVDIVTKQQATIAEQAARIEELEAKLEKVEFLLRGEREGA